MRRPECLDCPTTGAMLRDSVTYSERSATYVLQAVMLIGFAVVIALEALTISPLITAVRLVAFAAEAGALYAYHRGHRQAQLAMVLLASLIIPAVVSTTQYDAPNTLALLIPSIFALIIGRPWLVGVSAVVTLGLFLVRDGGAQWTHSATFYVLYTMVVGGMALARAVMDAAHTRAEREARRSREALAHAEQQSQELALSNGRLAEQVDQQQRLLDLVATLETPAVSLAEGVLLAPIVGYLDTARSQAITARLLREAHERRARLVVLDITGVPEVDTGVARALLSTAGALRLLGCEVTISGISASVAATLARMGVDLGGVRAVRSPQDALLMT